MTRYSGFTSKMINDSFDKLQTIMTLKNTVQAINVA